MGHKEIKNPLSAKSKIFNSIWIRDKNEKNTGKTKNYKNGKHLQKWQKSNKNDKRNDLRK